MLTCAGEVNYWILEQLKLGLIAEAQTQALAFGSAAYMAHQNVCWAIKISRGEMSFRWASPCMKCSLSFRKVRFALSGMQGIQPCLGTDLEPW